MKANFKLCNHRGNEVADSAERGRDVAPPTSAYLLPGRMWTALRVLIPIQFECFQIDGVGSGSRKRTIHKRYRPSLRFTKFRCYEEITKHHAEKETAPGNQNVARTFHALTHAPLAPFPQAEIKG